VRHKVLFVSHASPTLLIEQDSEYYRFLKQFSNKLSLSEYDTLVTSSPHFAVKGKAYIVQTKELKCIQDYYGFPAELYRFCVNAQNDLELVQEILNQGFRIEPTDKWGLDHGAWVPLYILFGENVGNTVCVSCDPFNPSFNYELGSIIRKAADKLQKRVLFLASGSPTHRLDLFEFGKTESADDPLYEFDKILIHTLTKEPMSLLSLKEREREKYIMAQPEGGLGPLFTAMGFAGSELNPKVLYYGVPYKGVSVLAAELV
jgi:4,5-DOPA dioxygenase extradiol